MKLMPHSSRCDQKQVLLQHLLNSSSASRRLPGPGRKCQTILFLRISMDGMFGLAPTHGGNYLSLSTTVVRMSDALTMLAHAACFKSMAGAAWVSIVARRQSGLLLQIQTVQPFARRQARLSYPSVLYLSLCHGPAARPWCIFTNTRAAFFKPATHCVSNFD